MKEIGDESVDLILCDLPYGTTNCKWDSIVPFEPMWEQYRRIIKKNGVIVLFAEQPFTTKLIASNQRDFRYCWYWKKNNKTGALLAKIQPMRCIEDICVFIRSPYSNNTGMHEKLREWFFSELERSGKKRKDIDRITNSNMSSHYFTRGAQFAIPNREKYEAIQAALPGYFTRKWDDINAEFHSGMAGRNGESGSTYNPQGLKRLEVPKLNKASVHRSDVYQSKNKKDSIQEYEGYPCNLLEFDSATIGGKHYHPSQKPVALLEYLIRTYTNEGETVLDNCMGSGSTGVACVLNDRNFIGFELDPKYYEIAVNRIDSVAFGHEVFGDK